MKHNLWILICICITGLLITVQYTKNVNGGVTEKYIKSNLSTYQSKTTQYVKEKTITKDYQNCNDDTEISILDYLTKELSEIECIDDKKEWFIAYKEITDRYSNYFDTPETIYDVYTDEEIELICRAVETECYDCDFDSKCNVASVILNRINYENSIFGDTVSEVITRDNQFAYDRSNITEDTILSVMYAYEIEDTTGGCVAFRSDQKPDTWYGWVYSFTDNCGHHFYKEKEREKIE